MITDKINTPVEMMSTTKADNRNQIVVFALDEPRYALSLSAVERVVRSVEITPLPNAPAIIKGAINVQGKIIPVVNIRELLRLPAREINCDDHFIIARTQRRNVVAVSGKTR